MKLNNNKSVTAYQAQDIDKYQPEPSDLVIPPHIYERTIEDRFREKLKAVKVPHVIREILVLRFVYDLSFSDIREDLGLASTMTAYRLFERGLKYLKEIGFTDEDNEDYT